MNSIINHEMYVNITYMTFGLVAFRDRALTYLTTLLHPTAALTAFIVIAGC